MYYANANVNLMKKIVIQSETGTTISTNNASVKPWYMSCKNGKYLATITDNITTKFKKLTLTAIIWEIQIKG